MFFSLNNFKFCFIVLCQGDKLKIVNKLYPAQDFVLNSSYLGQAKEYFLSDVELADYSKPTEAAGQINRYVEEHTNNKIHDLISAG